MEKRLYIEHVCRFPNVLPKNERGRRLLEPKRREEFDLFLSE